MLKNIYNILYKIIKLIWLFRLCLAYKEKFNWEISIKITNINNKWVFKDKCLLVIFMMNKFDDSVKFIVIDNFMMGNH